MQTQTIPRRIAEVAGRQYGVVARRQLLDLGMSANAVDRALRVGRLHRMHPGVYAVGHWAITREGRWMAAVLLGGLQAVLSHRSAGDLWGLGGSTGSAIEIITPRDTRSRASIRRHHSSLPLDEVTVHRGIPTTTSSRTLFDLASCLSAQRLEAAMRRAEFLQLRDRLSLLNLLSRYPGHRGNATLRRCLARLDSTVGFTRSELEERFIAFLDRAGMPRPALNVRLEVRGRWFEVDCLWRPQRLVVELDGRAAHQTRLAFEADRERDRQLQSAGWRVVRITWRQLHDQPASLALDLRPMLHPKTRVRDNVQT